MQRIGRHGTLLLWGVLLGSGVVTILPHASTLLLPAAALMASSTQLAIAGGIVYGTARAVLSAAVALGHLGRETDPTDLVEPFRAWLTRRGLLVAVFGAMVLVSMALAGS